MRIYAACLSKMPHILPHFWLASFPHIFQKKSRYKPVSLLNRFVLIDKDGSV